MRKVPLIFPIALIARVATLLFSEIYALDVVSIPTNMPILRKDDDDAIYRTGKERDAAIIDLILDCREKGQPILVGTTSIDKSEEISKLLKKENIKLKII